MIKLNLAYPERSDIPYEIINFPDGHRHLKILQVPLDKMCIHIISRFNNMDDLFIMLQANEILTKNGCSYIYLKIPYLLTSRCDRRFSGGEAIDLNIIVDILNNQGFSIIETVDYHSEASNRLINIDNDKNTFFESIRQLRNEKNALIIYPDEGAFKRYPYIGSYCKKTRNSKGEIIGMELIGENEDSLINGRDVIVCDDLIDGGATFIKLAELLRTYAVKDLYLFCSHGIFSKGYDELLKYYKHIWCTNSFRDIYHPDITCIDVYTGV